MPESDDKISELEARIDRLVRNQIDFQREISALRGELVRLRSANKASSDERANTSSYSPPENVGRAPVRPVAPNPPPIREEPKAEYEMPRQPVYEPDPVLSNSTVSSSAFSRFASQYADNARANLEEFVGKNLISLIGIVVLILGVGIGAKYAIDNNLISPLARIVIGYIFGFGLVGLAIKLKGKYHNFSAVLISGGMAIMYFVTYFAYSSYQLISQMSAFALMAMFTVFTVTAALVYSRQVIAHIGLVGAYAVPFLLSNDSGNYLALFTYMTVVNSGILAISVRRDWKPIFYTSSVFTWLFFSGWLAAKYTTDYFGVALTFASIFFGLFYATKLIQKRFVEGENALIENIVSTFTTGFIFYGVCFRLADSILTPTQISILFATVAAIGCAILVTSLRLYGRFFMYLVIPFTWAIYANWYVGHYNVGGDFSTAIIFAGLFFAIFYFSVLFHRLVEGTFSFIEHTSLILANAFVFFGFGYSILDRDPLLGKYLGLYTAGNAALHLGVAFAVARWKPKAVDVVQVLTILILTFASIAIPVQFDGNLVTMIWAAEGAALFWFGRTRGVQLFEWFSYPVMLLASGSMFVDWSSTYTSRISGEIGPMTPIANSDFITAIVFVSAFALIYITHRDTGRVPAIPSELVKPVGYVLATIGAFVLYNMFRIEIANYFDVLGSDVQDPSFGIYGDLDDFNIAWQINYTLAFLSAMAIANLRWLRSLALTIVNSTLAVFTLFVFSVVSMYLFYDLRVGYVNGDFNPAVIAPWMYIAIRPISYLFAFGLLYLLYQYRRAGILSKYVDDAVIGYGFDALAYGFVFILASCELTNLMGQFGIPDATKLGLSILWGVYALALVVIGIAKDKKHLRIAAFVLIAITLVKLFFYDIADLETIPKTILFVTLGITLLVVSFLYNKYKGVMFKADAMSEE